MQGSLKLVRLKQSAFSRACLHSFRFSPVCPARVAHSLANNKTTQITEYVAKGDFNQSNWLLPVVLCPVVLFTPITVTHNSACERDECSFMSVMAVALLVFPMANTCQSINRSISQSINQSIKKLIVTVLKISNYTLCSFPCTNNVIWEVLV